MAKSKAAVGSDSPSVHKTLDTPRVNYSLRREVAFVVIGSLVGAMFMHISLIYNNVFGGSQYEMALLIMARVVNSDIIAIGFALHITVATCAGIIAGIVLYKVFGLNFSRISVGFAYGIVIGLVVLVVFAVPVVSLVLEPVGAQIRSELPHVDPVMTFLNYLFSHIIWGASVGIVASFLTRNFGANYRCHRCDIEFSKRNTYTAHVSHIHSNGSSSLRRILILGGGYAGIGTLRRLQKEFEDSVDVGISIVSEDNFFLSTPLLAEMAAGHVEPRHISTPIRTFCQRARYYQAGVKSIDLENHRVLIQRNIDSKPKEMRYDYLVLTLGGKTNYYGNKSIENNTMTIKTLEDALALRNRIISMLENADQENDVELQSRMVTFVIVGGGFSGVETAGVIHEFVTSSAQRYYRNIEPGAIRVILVSATKKILPEIGDLGTYAERALRNRGLEIFTNTKLASVDSNSATLDDGTVIPSKTVVWAGGIKASPVIAALDVEHGSSNRVMINSLLQLESHPEVYALGDCAYLIDSHTDKPYPPTAQNAIRQAKIVAHNVTAAIKSRSNFKPFTYESVGSMATIGKRDGVALLFGIKITGILAWLLWRNYYLSRLPSLEKRIRVAIDWLVDLYVPSDVTRLDNIREKSTLD